MIQRLCKNCGSSFTQFTTVNNLCNRCQYNKMLRLRANSKTKAKPIQKIGKKARMWMDTRKEWIKLNPPQDGYWECYLRISPMCSKVVTIDDLSLDHVKTRSSHPELRYDLNNIKPACYPCNSMKGSVKLEKLAETYPQLRQYIE